MLRFFTAVPGLQQKGRTAAASAPSFSLRSTSVAVGDGAFGGRLHLLGVLGEDAPLLLARRGLPSLEAAGDLLRGQVEVEFVLHRIDVDILGWQKCH